MDRGAWQATVHRFSKSWTQLNPRAGLSRLRGRAVGVVEGGGQGRSATPGPPVVSIVVTRSMPAPPAAAGARAPGGLSRLPPWSLLYWTDRFRLLPAPA